jgi:(S)-mandelate dehydrogenase
MQRHYPRKADITLATTIEELRHIAKRRTPYFVYEYLEGGAEDELTLRHNRRVFADYRFVPRTLIDTTARNTHSTFFGIGTDFPVAIAPTGSNGMLWRDGDICLARAAAKANIPFCLSTLSNASPSDIAQTGARLWMQLYLFKNPDITTDILTRAHAANAEALIVTTDAQVFGAREWNARVFRKPGQLTLKAQFDTLRYPRWLWNVLRPGLPDFVNVAAFLPSYAHSARHGVSVIPTLLAPKIDWDDIARLRERWPRKLIIKGVLCAADARRAMTLGADGIVLTNHGGRQLDSCVSPMDVLAEVVQATQNRLTILIDSGFRRGSDIAKALALGADGVLIGRPTLYGLAAGGEIGASHALSILRSELERVLGQLGCRQIADLTPDVLQRENPLP